MLIWQLTLRFLIGGAVVVGVLLAARLAGTGLAGKFMTIPALTALSLWFVYTDKGAMTASAVARAGLLGLLPVAAYLLCIAWAFEHMPRLQAFALSLAVWMAGVAVLQFINYGWMQWLITAVTGSVALNFIRSRHGWEIARFALVGLVVSAILYALGQEVYTAVWYGFLFGSILTLAFLIYRKPLGRDWLALIWMLSAFVMVISLLVAALLDSSGHSPLPVAALTIGACIVVGMSQDREWSLRAAAARPQGRYLR